MGVIIGAGEDQGIVRSFAALRGIAAILIVRSSIYISFLFEIYTFQLLINFFVSAFGLYHYCRIFLRIPIFVEGELYFVTVGAVHYCIPIFDSLIGKTVVFAGGSYFRTVGLFHYYGGYIYGIRLEFLYCSCWEEGE